MSTHEALDNRDLGQLKITIGTSLALEGAFGIYPDRPEKYPEIHNYTHLWINVETMVRNVIHCLNAEDRMQLLADEIANLIVAEMDLITGAVQAINAQVKVVFYRNKLTNLSTRFPKANLWQPSTDRQKIIQGLMEDTLLQVPELITEIDYREFDIDIQGEGKVMILTHQPIDLLSQYRFDNLTLLESHTGRLKKKHQWGSKLGVKDETIPFNVFTIQIFGDNNNALKALPTKYRKVVQAMIKHERWTGLTTLSRINQSIDRIKDPHIKQELKEIARSK